MNKNKKLRFVRGSWLWQLNQLRKDSNAYERGLYDNGMMWPFSPIDIAFLQNKAK